MNTALTAIDDGWTNANYNWADLFFVVATALALLAAVGYFTVAPPTGQPPTRRLAHWAAGLLALAIAATAFALFLL